MGKVTFTERVGEVSTTYEFESYEDFKDWENKLNGVVVSADHLTLDGDIWIKNTGVKPNLPGGTVVEVKFTDDSTCEDTVDTWVWELFSEGQDDGEITHYRVVSK